MAGAFSEEWLQDYQRRRSGLPVTVGNSPIVVAAEPQNTISLMLPTAPSANHLFANVPGVGRVKTKQYRTWLRYAAKQAAVGMMGKKKIEGSFKATIHISADGDLDNRIKGLIDLCVAIGAVVDDVHLDELHVYRQRGSEGTWIVLEAATIDVRSAASG